MGPSPRVCVLGAAADDEAARLGRALDARVVSGFGALVRARPEVVIVRAPVSGLARAAALTTLAGAPAVLVAPIGPAARLPWWGRRFHRFVLPTQAEARVWAGAGVAIGRIVVVGEGTAEEERAALHALVEEVRAMTLRPDIRRRAR